MNFPDHSRWGIRASVLAFGVGMFTVQDLGSSIFLGLSTYYGAIFPDLDTESIPSRWTARAGVIFFLIMAYLNKPWPPAIAGALFFLVKADKHRGFTHKYWFPLGFIVCGIYLQQYSACAFGAGLLVHFMIDGISPFALKNWK